MTDAPRFGPPEGYTPPPSHPFVLYGNRLTDDEPWEEAFSILGEAPQGALADLAASVIIRDGQMSYSATATVRFLAAVIVPGDEQRFAALVSDKDRPVPLDQLGAVMLWASGQIAGRPTSPLSSSTGGQRDTEPGSEGASDSEATSTPAG